MDITIFPAALRGTVAAIPSKSEVHRFLICAAFADDETEIDCSIVSRDMAATAACLNALGASVLRTAGGFLVQPALDTPRKAVLSCGESGSTLRFLLPVAGALGVDATFQLAGRLSQRPLSPLWELMQAGGCTLSRPTPDTVRCTGKLRGGEYAISGAVSSQFISGLLLAAALMEGTTHIALTGRVESKPYIAMTQEAMRRFGVSTQGLLVRGAGFRSPKKLCAEGDWSNAAFFLAANALGSSVTVTGLNPASAQGDRAIVALLAGLTQERQIDAADTPDLVPILAVAAAAKQGAVFTNIGRLRMKESDRVETTAAMLRSLGVSAQIRGETLRVSPAPFTGGTVDCANDHRIAMAAAIAATAASEPVTLTGAQCVEKSYPAFWQDYRALGGAYEQHIR